MKVYKPVGWLTDEVSQKVQSRHADMIAREEAWERLTNGLVLVSTSRLRGRRKDGTVRDAVRWLAGLWNS